MSQVQVQPVPAASESLSDRTKNLIRKVEERAYDLFERRGRLHGHELEDWFQAESEVLGPCEYEMAKTDTDLTIAMNVPGFEAKDLKVDLLEDSLVVEGEVHNKDAGRTGDESFETETSRIVFQRIPLPIGVQSDLATAELKNQTLRITLPLSVKGKTAIAA